MSWFNIGRLFDVTPSPPSLPVHGTTGLVPGQMVACICDDWGDPVDVEGRPCQRTAPPPMKGCVYTVASVRPLFGLMFISLAEKPTGALYHADFFRPVRPTSLAIFRDQRAPTDGVRDTERVS